MTWVDVKHTMRISMWVYNGLNRVCVICLWSMQSAMAGGKSLSGIVGYQDDNRGKWWSIHTMALWSMWPRMTFSRCEAYIKYLNVSQWVGHCVVIYIECPAHYEYECSAVILLWHVTCNSHWSKFTEPLCNDFHWVSCTTCMRAETWVGNVIVSEPLCSDLHWVSCTWFAMIMLLHTFCIVKFRRYNIRIDQNDHDISQWVTPRLCLTQP